MKNETSQWIAEEEERIVQSIRRVREASERELEKIPKTAKTKDETLSSRRIEFKPVYKEELAFLLEQGRITTEDADGQGVTAIMEGKVTNERGETETRLFRFQYAIERFKWVKNEYKEDRVDWQKMSCEDTDADCTEKRVKLPGYEDLGPKPDMPQNFESR